MSSVIGSPNVGGLRTCPWCQENVKDSALKCKYCQSSLSADMDPEAKAGAKNDHTVVYVIDKGLISFAKWAGFFLSAFVVVGVVLYGVNVEETLSDVERQVDESKKTAAALTKLVDDSKRGASDVVKVKQEAERLKMDLDALALTLRDAERDARDILAEIESNRNEADDIIVSLRVRTLDEDEQQQLEQVRQERPDLFSGPSGVRIWPAGKTIRVKFLDGTSEQHSLVRQIAKDWTKSANLVFEFVDSDPAEVRVSFDRSLGSWSYLGTDCLALPRGATMNLGLIHDDPATGLHEFGHLLGLIHEHQNPNANLDWDVPAVHAYFSARGMTRDQIEREILRPYDKVRLIKIRPFDRQSVMLYSFPGSLFRSGKSLTAGQRLSQSDRDFVALLYPAEPTPP